MDPLFPYVPYIPFREMVSLCGQMWSELKKITRKIPIASAHQPRLSLSYWQKTKNVL